jgi:Na+-transporting NADH:ubiquinone oxidoreductase subunit B
MLRRLLDTIAPTFKKGGRLARFYPLYEAIDTFFYAPGDVTSGTCHTRDAIDYKRMMMTVVVALLPCVFMAMWNTGLQANRAMADTSVNVEQVTAAPGWRGKVLEYAGVGYNPGNFWDNLAHGAVYFLPVYIVCMTVGGLWEVLFAIVRRHEVNEGFFVTGLLFPLTLPPTIPLWQVAVGISFGVVVGKEIFGGTGRNFLNPALTARAFLYFAYPAEISGDAVWTALDGFSGATALGIVASDGMTAVEESYTWLDCFLGTIQGSMGETSVLACLLGVAFMLYAGVASWRIMLSMLIGCLATGMLFYGLRLAGQTSSPTFEMAPHWHLVVGGLAFGLVFMATDPVSAAQTKLGQWIYGLLIGAATLLVRVVNPAFPEGVMLAILLGNTFAPLIDYYVLRANIRRRAAYVSRSA